MHAFLPSQICQMITLVKRKQEKRKLGPKSFAQPSQRSALEVGVLSKPITCMKWCQVELVEQMVHSLNVQVIEKQVTMGSMLHRMVARLSNVSILLCHMS